MEIKNLKDFKALVKACRSLGVDAIEVGELKIALGKEPVSKLERGLLKGMREAVTNDADVKVPLYDGPITDPESIPDAGLTEDQLMFYSAQGHDQVEQ